MCGRYYVDDETAQEIEKLVRQVDEKMQGKRGDVYPTEKANVLKAYEHERTTQISAMDWGFPGIGGKGVIINAKSETVKEKKMFTDSVQKRRCIIPAKGFYEWNQAKEKITFEALNQEILYMAGIWKPYEDNLRFVILTTKANESVREVHDRMPLLFTRQEADDWILHDEYTEDLLHKIPQQLKKICEYEQYSIFHLK